MTLAACLGIACVTEVPTEVALDGGGQSTSTTTSPASEASTEDPGSTTSTGDPEAASSSSTTDGGGPVLDVGAAETSDGQPPLGCDKVDFLFVIDSSGSMAGEQENLVASFPGFIDAIQDTLTAQDYHIAVVDTDGEPTVPWNGYSCDGEDCGCEPGPDCCLLVCSDDFADVLDPDPAWCLGESCSEFTMPTGCAATLGAGRRETSFGQDCGVLDDRRFMTEQQPDLGAAFECVARVGIGGSGLEQPMQAMTHALHWETGPQGCHEGFLRDDAIVVVTIISDEDDWRSPGNPDIWQQALTHAKGGELDAIVILSLLGDSALPDGVCTEDQAEDAPLLRAFTEAFPHGRWASVCEPSYESFFADAVAVIDQTCDEYQPEG